MSTVLAGFFLLSGASLALIASIGLVRFPDVFTRMHAATKPQTLGIVCILIGLALRLQSVVGRDDDRGDHRLPAADGAGGVAHGGARRLPRRTDRLLAPHTRRPCRRGRDYFRNLLVERSLSRVPPV